MFRDSLLKVSVLLAFFLFYSSSFSAPPQTPETCGLILQKMEARLQQESPVSVLPHLRPFSPKVKGGLFRLTDHPAYDPNAIYLGVANSAGAGSHHYYLIINNKRFDSYGSGGLGQIVVKERGGPPLASDGVVFKLKIDQATLAQLDKSTLLFANTCLHEVCRILNKANIDLLQGGKEARRYLVVSY